MAVGKEGRGWRANGAGQAADRRCGAGASAGRARTMHPRIRRDRYKTDSGGRNRFCTHGACVPGRAVRGRAAVSGARPFHEEVSHARGRPARCGRCARCRGKRVCLGCPSAGVRMRMGLARCARGVRRERSSVRARKGAGCRPVACSPVRRGCRAVRRPRGARPHVARRGASLMGTAEMLRDPARRREPDGRRDCAVRAAAAHPVAAAAGSTERCLLRVPASVGVTKGGARADTANGRQPAWAAGRSDLRDGCGARSNVSRSRGATRTPWLRPYASGTS